MDMSFANQALSVEYMVRNAKELKPAVYAVPADIDSTVSRLKLDAMGIKIDTLTAEQEKYLPRGNRAHNRKGSLRVLWIASQSQKSSFHVRIGFRRPS